jgi:hypothetical protein
MHLDRYLIVRQFLVVLIVFVTNMCGAALKGVEVLGLTEAVQKIFSESSVAMILFYRVYIVQSIFENTASSARWGLMGRFWHLHFVLHVVLPFAAFLVPGRYLYGTLEHTIHTGTGTFTF